VTAAADFVVFDEPRGEGDRWGVYVVAGRYGQTPHRIAATSLEGVGPTIRTLIEEEQIERGDSIGVLDLLDRHWLINPYAKLRT
jgi:hypothetical protein